MVDNKIKLSIIIPYFETYELTDMLIKSLIAQKTDEVEIFLIDDGSDEERFNKYITGDKNTIHVIHQENKGVSYTRNRGIRNSRGKYIAFIDSDDMIMSNYINTLLELINNHEEDIIYFNWLDINTNEVIRHPSNPAVWKAIYKKEILPKFDETLKAREDYFFNQELDKQKHTKYYYDKVLYIYNSNREDSLTQRNARGEL